MKNINKAVFITLLVGIASQYAPGVMESVIGVRQVPGRTNYTVPLNLERFDGFVAMESCKELGNEYYIRPSGQKQWELFLVVDCSGHTSTSSWMARNNILVEVDHTTANRWDTVGRGIEIEISKIYTQRYFEE